MERQFCVRQPKGTPAAPAGALENARLHVVAWGDDGAGQCLGGARSSAASIVSRPTAVRLGEGQTPEFVQLAAGWEQSFLVSGRGALWGGGSNRAACLSKEDVEQVFSIRPLDLDEAEDFKAAAMDAGREHFVAIQQDGMQLMTWGSSNEFGQTGQGADRVGLKACPLRRFAVLPGVKVTSVACGQDHALALTERGEVFAWGDGLKGQLGRPPKNASAFAPAPQRVEAGSLRGLPVRQVAAGMHHSMVLGISGQVAAWGCNRRGKLGLGPEFQEAESVPLPTLVSDLPGPVRSIAAGGRHSAVVLRKGLVLLAGDNRRGQLGHPPEDLDCRSSFGEVAQRDFLLRVRMVALGEAHSLFLSYEGELFGVGANDRGQVGEPLGEVVHTPRRVQMPDREWILWAVATGPNHSLVLASEPVGTQLRRQEMQPEAPVRTGSAPDGRLARHRHSVVGLGAPVFLKDVEEMDEEDGPIERTLAYHGGRSLHAATFELPPKEFDGQSDEDPTPLTRLRSVGCGSKAARAGKLRCTLSFREEDQTRQPPPTQDAVVDCVVLERQAVRPGVASKVDFLSFTVDELAKMAKDLPADGSCAKSEARDNLRATMGAVLKCPTVVGACFLFRATNEAKLNADGLCEQLLKIRRRLGGRLDVDQSWAAATLQGLKALAPAGGLLRNMRSCDQVRALIVWLLVPNWPALLAGYPEEGAQQSRSAHEAFNVAKDLLRTIARLPVDGRAAIRDIVAEECSVEVLRDVLLASARALANAALRSCMKAERLDATIWEAVLLLQILWAADCRRMDAAAEAAQAAREADRVRLVAPGRIGRSLSKTLNVDAGASLLYEGGFAAGVAIPRSAFQIDALETFPAHEELKIFIEHAHMQVIDPAALCSETKWEIDPKQGSLPTPFQSFMAHGNLVPVSFKQQVLQVENQFRQHEEQQRQIMNQAGGFLQLLPWGGIHIPQQAVYFVLEVKRDQLINDTYGVLRRSSPDELRKPLRVKFANEEGVDEGGVAREYFRLLSEQLFAPEYGMFKSDPDSRYLWFDPGSFNEPQDFEMVGTVLGLAVYNNLPGLDVSFPPVLFKKLKDLTPTTEDLRVLFPSHALSLQAVMDWRPPPGLTFEQADTLFQNTFCLDFSVSYELFGESKTVNLLGGDGEDDHDSPPPVTLARRGEFAQAFKDWYLTTGVAKQFDAFREGFRRVCDSPVFKCLSAVELEAIVCGEKDLDFDNLKKGAKVIQGEVGFRDGYLDGLWEILGSFDASQKRQFLRFVTGSDLAPVGGLERLQLKLQRNGGEPTNRLPTSQTCFNLLMLPEYEDQEKLRRLLVSAIQNADGFGLQ